MRLRRVRRAVVLAVISLGGLPGAGCSQPTDVQPFPGGCISFEAVSWNPRSMAQNVPTNAAVKVTFADYPDPETVNASSLLLTTGIFWHTGIYRVDLLTKTVLFRAPTPLRPDLEYTVTVFPPLRSLQGCGTSLQQRSFRTGEQPTPDPPEPPATPLSAVLPIFAASCSGSGCHRAGADAPTADGCLEAPAKGLSLCDTQAYDALVGVPSREVSRLRLVAPHDSSRSFLMRKLLSPDPSGPPVPTTPGHRDPPGSALDETALRTISNWIDTGAVR